MALKKRSIGERQWRTCWRGKEKKTGRERGQKKEGKRGRREVRGQNGRDWPLRRTKSEIGTKREWEKKDKKKVMRNEVKEKDKRRKKI